MGKNQLSEMDEIFDKRQKDFPSNAHRIIWYLGASLLPFSEVIPSGLPKEKAGELALAEKSLHEFFSALYADMYRNPSYYRMTESQDLYFKDGEWYKARPDMLKAKGKNAHVMKSLGILFDIGRIAAQRGDALVMTESSFSELFRKIVPKSVSRAKMKGFLEALRRFGLEISGESELTVRSSKYPKMLIALKALSQHGGKEDHQVRFFAFHRCDFKAVEKDYEPAIGDVLHILPEDMRRPADKTIGYMTDSGYKMELQMGGYPSAQWIVKFCGSKRFKASTFFWLGFSIEYQNMFHVSLHCMNPQYLLPIVYAKGSEYAAWFDENWHRDCNGCGYCRGRFKTPGPYLLKYDGKKRGLCHQNWLGSRNPTEEEVQNILKMVELHTEAGMI